ncbi:MAG: hypothetical protein H7318_17740 [Oligoflexus sp.]|nr:hypothetical protein [Oligoflexus sp.]
MVPNLEEEATNLPHVLRTASSYRITAIFNAAVKLDVFSLIELHQKEGLSVEHLSTHLSISMRSADKLLGGLCALELIRKCQSTLRFRNSPSASRYLIRSSSQYLGEGLLMLGKIGDQTWSTLTDVIRQGAPLAEQRTDQDQAEFWKILTRAIRPLSEAVAQSLWRLLKAQGFKVEKVLDLAGGSGVFGHSCLQSFSEAVVVQVDWPHVNESALATSVSLGVGDRFRTISGSIFTELWEHDVYDVVILSHILHQESPEVIHDLLKRVAKVLRPGGKVVINEYCLDHEKAGPYYGLIFAVNMLLQNHGGDSYSLSEYIALLQKAGLLVESLYSPVPPSTLLIAELPIERPIPSHESLPYKEGATATRDEDYPRHFADARWDTSAPADLEPLLMKAMHQQLRFASRYNDFWRDRLSETLLRSPTFTRQHLEMIPLLDKKNLRLLQHGALLPRMGDSCHVVRGTGGTTGAPVSISWKRADWQAALETITRFIEPIRALKPKTIWNGYNQGHVSGPIFDDVIRQLGATSLPRHFRSDDGKALEDILRVKPTVLVITPQSGSGKGGSLEDFLEIDPNFIKHAGVKGLIISSTVLAEDLKEELKEQGVTTIVNFYGSTEALPDAVSCPIDPRSFHLCQGHVLVEVIDANGQHVKNGGRGLLVVSRIGSSSAAGIGPSLGTQLFRYVVGDKVSYREGPCACGRSTASIYDIERVLDIEEKLQGGCQKWE